jgi:hypothetical protein
MKTSIIKHGKKAIRMERLAMETTNGTQPIDLDMVEKYDLHKGTHSPFTNPVHG